MSADPTRRFSDRVEDYARYRPGYPPRLLPLLAEHLGLEPAWVIADLGSGTGLSSVPFVEHGHPVIGVEPNEAMRRAAEAKLSRFCAAPAPSSGTGVAHPGGSSRGPSFRSIDGRAEATGLPDRSVDLAIAGQAFHWFDVPETRRELLRILRQPLAALFWNTRRTGSTPFLRDYEELLLRYGTDYQQVRHDHRPHGTLESFFRGGLRRQALAHEQRLDREGLLGRLRSSSYTPAAGDPAREEMLAAAGALFDRHQRGGAVTLEYDTEVYMGRLG